MSNNTVIQDLTSSKIINLPISEYKNPYDFNVNYDGSIMTFLANEGQIYIWNIETDMLVAQLIGNDPSNKWSDITLSANGKILSGLDQFGEIDIWQSNDVYEFEFYEHTKLNTALNK
jgi:WD40 repeat protein